MGRERKNKRRNDPAFYDQQIEVLDQKVIDAYKAVYDAKFNLDATINAYVRKVRQRESVKNK